MTSPAVPDAPPADRCPGVLRPHQAADGAMIRVRVPGGQTTGAALRQLGEVAQTYGSGLLQLTSRGSVQVRGLASGLGPTITVADAVADAGLFPSSSHDRVRNVLASPLTGLDPDRPDLRPLVRDLDAALCADPDLASLPGRFLFVLDDGRGDVSGLGLDLGYRADDLDGGTLLVGDEHTGAPVSATDVVATLLELAHRFLGRRSGAWHVRELDAPLRRGLGPVDLPASGPVPLGVVGDHLSVGVPLGLLGPAQVRAVADVVGDGPLVLTPWRGIVVPDAAAALPVLRDAGLVVDDAAAWTLIGACVGAPWCDSGRADTRALAHRLADAGGPAELTYLSGCERRCGAPATDHLDLVAPDAATVNALAGARA